MPLKFYKSYVLITLLAFTAAASLFSSYQVQASADVFTAVQRAEIKQMIRGFLQENPDAIATSISNYQQQQQRTEETRAQNKIKKVLGTLISADAPSVGPIDADVTIVEFFDYNCGYCKKALPDIQSILDTDKNVRFVFKEMPILGDASRVAATWSIAAHKQGKYFEYHVALMKHRGPKNAKSLGKLASDIGLDAKQMQKDANSVEIKKLINADAIIARDIGVRGTPAFIVGDQFFPGYIGEAGLKDAINKARDKK